MEMNTFQIMSMRTMPPEYSDMAKANYALGATGEAGEVADLVKKEVFHKHPVDADGIKKEIGDTLHYLAGLATMYGLTLEEIATANIEKLQKRYPTGFSSVDSIKRVDVT